MPLLCGLRENCYCRCTVIVIQLVIHSFTHSIAVLLLLLQQTATQRTSLHSHPAVVVIRCWNRCGAPLTPPDWCLFTASVIQS